MGLARGHVDPGIAGLGVIASARNVVIGRWLGRRNWLGLVGAGLVLLLLLALRLGVLGLRLLLLGHADDLTLVAGFHGVARFGTLATLPLIVRYLIAGKRKDKTKICIVSKF